MGKKKKARISFPAYYWTEKDILNVLEDGVALEYLRDKHASDLFHNVEAIEAAHARFKQALN